MATPLQSNFAFLHTHHPQLVRLGVLAESYFPTDPNTALIKLRQLNELLAQLLAARAGVYTNTNENQKELLDRLHATGILPRDIADLFHQLRRSGNDATHALKGDHRTALTGLKLTWQVGLWFHRTFHDAKFKSGPFLPPTPPEDQTSDLAAELHRLQDELTHYKTTSTQTTQVLAEMEARLRAAEDEKAFWETFAAETEQAKNTLAATLAAQQQQAAAEPKATLKRVAKASTAAAQHLQLDEASTRDLIDAQLREAGWEVDSRTLRYAKGTRPESGKFRAIAEWPVLGGAADYVLFAGNKPLAVVEAKRKNLDVSASLKQAERYSRDIQRSQYVDPGGPWGPFKIPFAFSANGRPFLRQLQTKSGIWFRDLRQPHNLSRPLDGWHSPEGLTALFKQDTARAHNLLTHASFDYGFPLRGYQRDAIRAVETSISSGQRAMLLAMATGTGKTKTCIALVYRLLKAQRFRRILFLVDREALGTQAADAFKDTRMENLQTFAEAFGIKELGDGPPDSATSVQIATVQSMVHRVLYAAEARPPVDQFDCIVVDECHRGYLLDRELSEHELTFRSADDYFSKYRRVLDSFDAVKIGLTATPALHTTQIFGQPVFTYSYREAVLDGFLVDYEPPIQIKTELSEQGITFEAGQQVRIYDPRTHQLDLFETPDTLSFEVEAFNRKVINESFNRTVCTYLARQLDPSSRQKTLIFCARDEHADTVVQLLKEALAEQYGSVEDDAVVKITGKAADPSKLIRQFKNEHLPNIAVTVDLLTTGIDVPEICNLVFLRRVNSRILFDQMLGRATRLCDKVGKQAFRVYDAVRIFEALEHMTQMQPVAANPNLTFTQLAGELVELTHEAALQGVLDQFVAKLQSKKRFLTEQDRTDLETATGLTPDGLIQHLRGLSAPSLHDFFTQHPAVADILDRRPPGATQPIYLSEHTDQLLSAEPGYGTAQRPQDYLDEFAAFIRANQDKLPALAAVVTRPRDLTRRELRTLLFELDRAGYSETRLESAWRSLTNQEMAARIVGFIRQAATGEKLVPYAERVDHALQKMLGSQNWTNPQREWLRKIAAQTKANLIVDREALNDPDQIFRAEGGGFDRLDRLFDGHLATVLATFNETLWQTAAA